mgnify:FL=1
MNQYNWLCRRRSHDTLVREAHYPAPNPRRRQTYASMIHLPVVPPGWADSGFRRGPVSNSRYNESSYSVEADNRELCAASACGALPPRSRMDVCEDDEVAGGLFTATRACASCFFAHGQSPALVYTCEPVMVYPRANPPPRMSVGVQSNPQKTGGLYQ